MKEFKVENHASSLLPDGKEWKLVWSDEFDGTELDMTKWDYRLNIWGKRHVTFGTEGVKLDGNSNAVFTVYEKDGEICSCQLQTGHNFMDEPRPEEPTFGRVGNSRPGLTWPIGKLHEPKFVKKYGYFECRCKLQKKDGWWSAFWLQSPIIGATLDPATSGVENDIMESFAPGEVAFHVNHYGGYGEDHKSVWTSENQMVSLDEYHTFGMLWTPEGYTFYIDGKQDGETLTGAVSHIPQFILISTEVRGYRSADHCATEEAKLAVGDEFIVDYVRVFDEVK
ncbi:MAG: glycoside hydrolase family 16 protein [Clostridia bacterium]|nr:glycoside hydrolase family 16 protein [Clostridia bacterium]